MATITDLAPTGTLTFHDARTAFRATVAEVAARAKERLPQAVNGRIESAVKLVLMHDIEPQDDGSILVGSSSDALRQYRLTGTSCECQDFTRGQAPEGWCQHRIAAGIQKRVVQVLAALPPVPVVPDVLPEAFPDNDPEEPAAPASPAVPAALPEAPASLNVRLTMDGREVQLTLRDTDETRLLSRLQAVLAQYPLPEPPASPQGPPQGHLSPQQHNAAAMYKRVTDFCLVHNVGMQLNQKNGRSWHSHRLDDGSWCKGK